MMLAGVDVTPVWTSELARMVRAAGADALADRLDRAAIVSDAAFVFALTIDEEAIILGVLDDRPDALPELRAVLANDHLWRPTVIARANAKTVHEAMMPFSPTERRACWRQTISHSTRLTVWRFVS